MANFQRSIGQVVSLLKDKSTNCLNNDFRVLIQKDGNIVHTHLERCFHPETLEFERPKGCNKAVAKVDVVVQSRLQDAVEKLELPL